MRIAIGGYCHETNSFCNIPVTQEVIDGAISRGSKLYNENAGVRNCIGGYLYEAKRLGIETVLVSCVGIGPSGPTVQKAYENTRDTIVSELWQAHLEKPLDGIALNLHGAGVAQGYDDLEADLLRAVRDRFGSDIPIAISLDLHANITPEMVALCDIAVGYKCYPHVDLFETGSTSMVLLHDMIQNGSRPCLGLVKLPWMIAPAFGVTLSGPALAIKQYMQQRMACEDTLLDASFFHGFSYADVPFGGVSVVTVAKNQADADRFAHDIAAFAWARRYEFATPTYSAAEAMDLAENAEAPVVINESSDNPGGGTPGDGTHLLREMLKRNIPGSVFGFICDSEVVDLAVNAGVRGHITCLLGGKTDDLHGTPIQLTDAYVKTISDGRFIQKSPMGKGSKVGIGTTVRLTVGNVDIIVAKARCQTKDDGPFRIVGIDWQEQRILALKSTQHFKGWWQDKAKSIIPCDSPGIHSADLTVFDFKKLNKNVFPFVDATWE